MSFNRTVSRLGLQTFLPNFSGPLNRGPMVWSEMAPKGLPHPILGDAFKERGPGKGHGIRRQLSPVMARGDGNGH